MSKQKTCHEIVKALLVAGYSCRELSRFYGLSPSTINHMGNNSAYAESADTRALLSSKRPRFIPRKTKRIRSNADR